MPSPGLDLSCRHPAIKLWSQDSGAAAGTARPISALHCRSPLEDSEGWRSRGEGAVEVAGAAQRPRDVPGGDGCLVQPPFCSHRKNYEALCQMYEKIQPLLENLHRNFIETRNNIGEQSGVGRAGQRGG